MIRSLLCIALCLLATASGAQQTATPGTGAVLRVLEKVNGTINDVELRSGASFETGRLRVTLQSCRYPPSNPSGEAYAFVIVEESGDTSPRFEGWMIASSPALNALEHPRYDVWVLRCQTE